MSRRASIPGGTLLLSEEICEKTHMKNINMVQLTQRLWLNPVKRAGHVLQALEGDFTEVWN